MSSLIVSSLPGRLRARHASLRERTRLAAVARTAAAWPEMLGVEENARTGSLLLHYDAARIARAAMETRVLRLLGAEEIAPAAALAPSRARTAGAPRVRANRWAKRGMLASLGISLLLAAVGTKRWHALTGIAFLHALAVHLWVHRRHLTR